MPKLRGEDVHLYPIDLSGKNGVILGVANDRSIAWAIARVLAEAGARLAFTYQNDRLKDRVERLAGTLDGSLSLPCDASDDQQIIDLFQRVGDSFGDLSFLVHSIAFANREDLTRRIPPGPGSQRLLPHPPRQARRTAHGQRRQRHRHDLPGLSESLSGI